MIGIDTNILVAHALTEHSNHDQVRQELTRLVAINEKLALSSRVLAEFLHVVTDSRRFHNPLSMERALAWANLWSQAKEVEIIHPNHRTHAIWLHWQSEHCLGRKRLLDTLLAATWHTAGVTKIFTLNPKDFIIFDVFQIHQPR